MIADGSINATLPPPIGSGVIHINGTAFNPQSSNVQFEITGVGLSNLSALPATFLASVSLPNRAQIKQVVFVYIDDNPTGDVRMDLDFQPFDYVGYGQMATAASSGAEASIRYSVVTNIIYDIVDNTANTHLLTVWLPPGTDIMFLSARIDYSYNAYAPAIYK